MVNSLRFIGLLIYLIIGKVVTFEKGLKTIYICRELLWFFAVFYSTREVLGKEIDFCDCYVISCGENETEIMFALWIMNKEFFVVSRNGFSQLHIDASVAEHVFIYLCLFYYWSFRRLCWKRELNFRLFFITSKICLWFN